MLPDLINIVASYTDSPTDLIHWFIDNNINFNTKITYNASHPPTPLTAHYLKIILKIFPQIIFTHLLLDPSVGTIQQLVNILKPTKCKYIKKLYFLDTELNSNRDYLDLTGLKHFSNLHTLNAPNTIILGAANLYDCQNIRTININSSVLLAHLIPEIPFSRLRYFCGPFPTIDYHMCPSLQHLGLNSDSIVDSTYNNIKSLRTYGSFPIQNIHFFPNLEFIWISWPNSIPVFPQSNTIKYIIIDGRHKLKFINLTIIHNQCPNLQIIKLYHISHITHATILTDKPNINIEFNDCDNIPNTKIEKHTNTKTFRKYMSIHGTLW